jgi:hypothetical protein
MGAEVRMQEQSKAEGIPEQQNAPAVTALPKGGTAREAKEALKIENRKYEIGRGRGSVSAPSRA